MGRAVRMRYVLAVVDWSLRSSRSTPLDEHARRLLKRTALYYGSVGWDMFMRACFKVVRHAWNKNEEPLRHPRRWVAKDVNDIAVDRRRAEEEQSVSAIIFHATSYVWYLKMQFALVLPYL